VIATPEIPPQLNVKLPANPICIRVKRPDNIQSIGTVLRKEDCWVQFGQRSPAFVQVRSAVRYALYGNVQFEIPPSNKVKTLLLAHNNAGIRLHPSDGQTPLPAQKYLEKIKRAVNSEQLSAISSALTISPTYRGYMTLVSGPPGRKTSVSTRIALYHRLQT
jgi:hypothetical protein